MKRLLLSSLVSACAFAALLPVHADEVQTTTIQTTPPPPLAQPQVVDSYMKPTVTQTKSVTTSDGDTHSSTAPMIMERHERVVVPTSEVTTTTTSASPKVTTEEFSKSEARVASPRRVIHHVSYRPSKHYVAHRTAPRNRAIAVTHLRKTVVEPQVIQQTQTVEQRGVIMDRRDPALDQQ
jgi:hypothetical protein